MYAPHNGTRRVNVVAVLAASNTLSRQLIALKSGGLIWLNQWPPLTAGHACHAFCCYGMCTLDGSCIRTHVAGCESVTPTECTAQTELSCSLENGVCAGQRHACAPRDTGFTTCTLLFVCCTCVRQMHCPPFVFIIAECTHRTKFAAHASLARPTAFACEDDTEFDVSLGGFIRFTSSNSRNGCEADCDNEPTCVHFDFSTKPGAQACKLLDRQGFGQSGSDDGRTTCFMVAKKQPGTYHCSRGQIALEKYITVTGANSKASCAKLCDGFASCKAFDFTTQKASGSCRIVKASGSRADPGAQNREYCSTERAYPMQGCIRESIDS